MKKITLKLALKKIQDEENIILRCNKMTHNSLKCYEWQKYIKQNWKMGIMKVKNRIILHPRIKFIYMYN